MRGRLIGAMLLAVAPARGEVPAGEAVDTAAVRMIGEEGLHRSRVMEILGLLLDLHGPRLTGSPSCLAACRWAQRTLEGWGLRNARL
ncbi:MAG: peptidase M28, partial [Bacteroidota bacterium]